MTGGRRGVPTRSRLIAAGALAATICAALAYGARAPGMTELRAIVSPGEKAEGFTLKDLDGKGFAFQPGKGGKPALLVFWVVACPLCREFLPRVSGLYDRYGRDIRFVAVNLDGKRFSNAVRKFVKESGIAYTVVFDEIRGDFFVASDPYGIEKTPTAVLIDRNGAVHSVWQAESMRDLFSGRFDAVVHELKNGARGKK